MCCLALKKDHLKTCISYNSATPDLKMKMLKVIFNKDYLIRLMGTYLPEIFHLFLLSYYKLIILLLPD